MPRPVLSGGSSVAGDAYARTTTDPPLRVVVVVVLRRIAMRRKVPQTRAGTRWGRRIRDVRCPMAALLTPRFRRPSWPAARFRRPHNIATALGAGLLVTVLVTAAAISILHFVSGMAGAKITTAEDAIWWALYTMLTIGYEKVPVTTEGWTLGAVLGFLGLGIFGSFSGLVAYWLLGSEDSETAAKLEEIRREIASLKEAIAGRSQNQ